MYVEPPEPEVPTEPSDQATPEGGFAPSIPGTGPPATGGAPPRYEGGVPPEGEYDYRGGAGTGVRPGEVTPDGRPGVTVPPPEDIPPDEGEEPPPDQQNPPVNPDDLDPTQPISSIG